jgi:hypothetical protein
VPAYRWYRRTVPWKYYYQRSKLAIGSLDARDLGFLIPGIFRHIGIKGFFRRWIIIRWIIGGGKTINQESDAKYDIGYNIGYIINKPIFFYFFFGQIIRYDKKE